VSSRLTTASSLEESCMQEEQLWSRHMLSPPTTH
jgi:hypothetical protein